MSCISRTSLSLRQPLSSHPIKMVQPKFGKLILPDFKPHVVNGFTLGYLGPNSKPIPMLDTLQQGLPAAEGIKIEEWPVFALTPKEIPLQTYGMFCCNATQINYLDHQYLLHLNPEQEVEDIEKHLLQDVPWSLTSPDTTIEVVPGTQPWVDDSVHPLFQALYKINRHLVKKVQFRHYPDDATKYGTPNEYISQKISVVSYLGKLFCHPVAALFPLFKPGGKPMRPHIKPRNA